MTRMNRPTRDAGFTSLDQEIPVLDQRMRVHMAKTIRMQCADTLGPDFLLETEVQQDHHLGNIAIRMSAHFATYMNEGEDHGPVCPHIGAEMTRSRQHCLQFMADATQEDYDEEMHSLQKFRARNESWFSRLPMRQQQNLVEAGYPLVGEIEGSVAQFMGFSVHSDAGMSHMIEYLERNVSPGERDRFRGLSPEEMAMQIASHIEGYGGRRLRPDVNVSPPPPPRTRPQYTAAEVNDRYGVSPSFAHIEGMRELQAELAIIHRIEREVAERHRHLRLSPADLNSLVRQRYQEHIQRHAVDDEVNRPEPLAPPPTWNGEGAAPSFASHFATPTEHVEERPADAAPAPEVDDMGLDDDESHPYDGFRDTLTDRHIPPVEDE